MGDLILYVALAAAGYVVAAKVVKKKEKLAAASMIQIWAILLLVFSMGARMGANEEIVRNLNRIGLQALIMAVAAVLGSVAAVSAARRLLNLDAAGRKREEAPGEGGGGIGAGAGRRPHIGAGRPAQGNRRR